MTTKQIQHYRALWAGVRRVLRAQGLSSAQCEARRHEIHVLVLGKPVSSTRLTNPQFDDVKKEFLRLANSSDLKAMEQAQDGARVRARYVVATLCAKIGYDDDRLQGLIDQMQREGRLRDPARRRGKTAMEEWDIERQRDSVPRLTLMSLTAGQLEPVIIALQLQAGRIEARQVQEALAL